MLDKNVQTTYIDAGMKFRGEIQIEGDLVVEGSVEGSLAATGSIRLNNGSLVKGNVKAPEVHLDGTLQGNIRQASFVHLSPSSKFHGDIESKELQIDRGASFSGSSIPVR